MKRIALFNHKGGVSKTTSAYHIAWMLTNMGKRVLMVDGDSQCNLSIIAMGEKAFERHLYNHPENTLKELLKPVFKAQPRLLEPLEAIKVKENPNLFIIPGSFDLTEYDVALGMSFGFNNSIGTLANLPGSFHYLFRKYEKKYDIEYTIIDMNPSLSAINQTLLLSSDFFIVPTSCDYFSRLAIKSLKSILPTWEKWAKNAREILNDSSYPLKQETPKFLGAIIQRFNIRKEEPTQANKEVIEEIIKELKEFFIPELKKYRMIPEGSNSYFDIRVPEFNTLNALYHQNGIPVFEITKEMMQAAGWFGKTLVTNEKKKKDFYNEYNKIANYIIKNAI